MKITSTPAGTPHPTGSIYLQRLDQLEKQPPEVASAPDITSPKGFISSSFRLALWGAKNFFAPIIALFPTRK